VRVSTLTRIVISLLRLCGQRIAVAAALLALVIVKPVYRRDSWSMNTQAAHDVTRSKQRA
jgi:hypothetical protein